MGACCSTHAHYDHKVVISSPASRRCAIHMGHNVPVSCYAKTSIDWLTCFTPGKSVRCDKQSPHVCTSSLVHY